MPFCNKCGTEVPENTGFCSKCGNALQISAQISEKAQSAVQGARQFTQQISQGVPPNLKEEASKKSHIISMSGFILIFLCFWMPFVGVQCGNNEVLSLSGKQITYGTEIKETLTNTPVKEVDASPFAIIANILALVGILLCNRLKNKKTALKFVIMNFAAFIIFMLMLVRLSVGIKFADMGNSLITVHYKIGYWLCIILSLALIGFAYYIIETTKKQKIVMIPFSVIIFASFVVFLTPPKIFAMSPKAKASEIYSAASTWIKMQQAYAAENSRFGYNSDIGYTPPGNGETINFKYETGSLQGRAVWLAKNINDLGKCKAGNEWIIIMKDIFEIEAKLPSDKNCQELTPKFKDLGESANTKASSPQSQTESKPSAQKTEDEIGNAIPELEAEAKNWQNGASKYKAKDSKFFAFNGKGKEDEEGSSQWIWIATSKTNIGDCPANSVWKMTVECTVSGDCYTSNEVPPKCQSITPKIITDYAAGAEQYEGY